MPATNPKNKTITDAERYENCYGIMERQRDALKRMWSEMPMTLNAIMKSDEAAKYLGTTRGTLKRWSDRGVLSPIVIPGVRCNYYMLGHLWVFKTVMLEKNGDCKKESTT